jgi:hypothetical protein
MCEYEPDCRKQDDPLAVALWEHPERAAEPVITVLCPIEYHRLGVVYDLPNRGRALVTPSFRFLRGAFLSNPDPSRKYGHFHAGITPTALIEVEEIEYGRCRCGTWSYRMSAVATWLEAWTPETLEWRRGLGLPEGKQTGNRSRPYMLAGYVKMADSAGGQSDA